MKRKDSNDKQDKFDFRLNVSGRRMPIVQNIRAPLNAGSSSFSPVRTAESSGRRNYLCRYFLLTLLPVTVSLVYYIYLSHLYKIDEVYEGTKLREYTIDEKLTLRIAAPQEVESLREFVKKYSICRAVYEISVLWQEEETPPDVAKYEYWKTHAKISYDWKKGSKNIDELFIPDTNKIATDAVMFLDTDVLVSCDDLAFAHTVWRSANGNRHSVSPSGSVTGFFPRLHRPIAGTAEASADAGATAQPAKYELLGPLSVWWNKAYSLMLPAGAIVHKKFMWHRSDENMPPKMVKYLSANPACTRLAFAMSVQSKHADAPIWVDVPVSASSNPAAQLTYFTEIEEPLRREKGAASRCVSDLMDVLRPAGGPGGVEGIAYSFHKASPAVNHWIF